MGHFVFAAKSQHPFVRHLPPLADVTQAVRLSQQTLKERDEVVMKPHRLFHCRDSPAARALHGNAVSNGKDMETLTSVHSPNIMSVG